MFLELLVAQQSKHLLPAVGGYGLECPTPMPNVEYILSNSSIKMSCMKMLVVIDFFFWSPFPCSDICVSVLSAEIGTSISVACESH